MAVEYGTDVKFVGGSGTAFLQVDMPASTADDILAIFCAFVDYDEQSVGTTMNAPSGWSGSGVTATNGIALFYKAGGTTTPAQITFTGNPVVAVAVCFSLRNQASSSPLTVGSSATTSGFGHQLSSLTTAPYPGSVFIGGIMSADNNTSFDLVGDITIAGLEGGMTILCTPTGNPLDPFDCQPHFGTNCLNIGFKTIGVAGDPAVMNWTSRSAFNPTSRQAAGKAIGFWVSPSQAPSAVTFISPTVGQLYAIGRDVPISFTAASDPTVATASLTYDIEYTLNQGITWVSLTTTGAGVISYDWDTTGIAPSSQVQVRVRADNGTEAGPWVESDVFSLLVDAAPLAPLNVQPTGIVNQQENLTITFTFNDPGDLQKTLEVQWSANADMSSPSTTGTITTSDQFYTFTAATDILASAVPIYYRVRNQGIVDSTNGAWSATKQILVTAPISAPNITSPTAGSPPTAGTWTGLFSGTGHVKIEYRILQGATPLFTSNEIFTSANSFPIGISFANGVAYTLYLKRAAADGLWSAEDSETFTPSYTGPDQPGLGLTVLDEAGYIQCVITNTDPGDIAYQELYVDDVLVSPPLPANTVFNYAGARSGVESTFRVRAYIVTTFGFTDSNEETATQNLGDLFLFEPTKESVTANFLAPPLAIPAETNDPETLVVTTMVATRNRVLPVAHMKRGYNEILSYAIKVPLVQISIINQLELWVGKRLCARDGQGTKVFGRLISTVPADWMNHLAIPLTLTGEQYDEEVI